MQYLSLSPEFILQLAACCLYALVLWVYWKDVRPRLFWATLLCLQLAGAGMIEYSQTGFWPWALLVLLAFAIGAEVLLRLVWRFVEFERQQRAR